MNDSMMPTTTTRTANLEKHSDNGMGRLTYLDDSTTIVLEPRLFLAKHQRQGQPWRISPVYLWMYGLSLLTYPMFAAVLSKYQSDFQQDWHQAVGRMMIIEPQHNDSTMDDGRTELLPQHSPFQCWWAQLGLYGLDLLAVWVLDWMPRVTSGILWLHLGLCMAYYASYAMG